VAESERFGNETRFHSRSAKTRGGGGGRVMGPVSCSREVRHTGVVNFGINRYDNDHLTSNTCQSGSPKPKICDYLFEAVEEAGIIQR
jgi:hypothetical protein